MLQQLLNNWRWGHRRRTLTENLNKKSSLVIIVMRYYNRCRRGPSVKNQIKYLLIQILLSIVTI
jgi:hypothetical protein